VTAGCLEIGIADSGAPAKKKFFTQNFLFKNFSESRFFGIYINKAKFFHKKINFCTRRPADVNTAPDKNVK
jgi:hypothetical protein